MVGLQATLAGGALPASFEEADAQHLHFYSRVTCVVAMVLVIGGVGLDWAFYPQHAETFALARLVVAGLIGLTLLSYGTSFGARHIRQLTYFWIALPQIMIAAMIHYTDGEASIYFVGLTFAISGVGVFLPITVLEAVAFSGLTMLAYLVACVARPGDIAHPDALAGQMVFILFYGVIAVTISVYSSRLRRQSYELQAEVQQQRNALLDINKALTEVKGQLIQREKMAAIGTLSAGLLHELNNPVNYSLMAINMGLTLPAAKNDDMLRESLNDAREGMDRVQSIVSDLKTFAYQKPGEDTQRPFLLERAVRSAQRLAGHELKGVEVVLDLPQDTHVVGDEPALIGVFINLLSNAAHALSRCERAQPRIDVRGWIEGGRMKIAVRDNGHGIAPEHLGRVFEPFFTTRDVGAGLGLGLSVSYGIVQRHGSTLSVQSEQGAWTEFSFDLARP
jgi:two-component system, sensor histidine kinase PhcS